MDHQMNFISEGFLKIFKDPKDSKPKFYSPKSITSEVKTFKFEELPELLAKPHMYGLPIVDCSKPHARNSTNYIESRVSLLVADIDDGAEYPENLIPTENPEECANFVAKTYFPDIKCIVALSSSAHLSTKIKAHVYTEIEPTALPEIKEYLKQRGFDPAIANKTQVVSTTPRFLTGEDPIPRRIFVIEGTTPLVMSVEVPVYEKFEHRPTPTDDAVLAELSDYDGKTHELAEIASRYIAQRLISIGAAFEAIKSSPYGLSHDKYEDEILRYVDWRVKNKGTRPNNAVPHEKPVWLEGEIKKGCINIIEAPLGMGKTTLIGKFTRESGCKVNVVAPLKSLVSELAKKFGTQNYQSPDLNDSDSIATCINSFHKLRNFNGTLVFDEITHSLIQLSSFVSKTDQIRITETLVAAMCTAETVVFADGVISPAAELLAINASKESGKALHRISTGYKPMQGRNFRVFTKREQAVVAVLDLLKSGKKVHIPTDSKGDDLAELFQEYNPLLINGTSDARQEPKIMADLSGHCEVNKIQLLITSPTVSSGVSIEGFDAVVGFFSAQTVSPMTAYQMSHRVRGVNVIRSAYIAASFGVAETNPKTIEERYIENNKENSVLIGINPNSELYCRNTLFMELCCSVEAEDNKDRNNYRGALITLLEKNQGYVVTVDLGSENKGARQALKQAKEIVSTRRVTAVVGSQAMTNREALDHDIKKENATVTEAAELRREKAAIANGMNIFPDDIKEQHVKTWDKGRYIKPLQRAVDQILNGSTLAFISKKDLEGDRAVEEDGMLKSATRVHQIKIIPRMLLQSKLDIFLEYFGVKVTKQGLDLHQGGGEVKFTDAYSDSRTWIPKAEFEDICKLYSEMGIILSTYGYGTRNKAMEGYLAGTLPADKAARACQQWVGEVFKAIGLKTKGSKGKYVVNPESIIEVNNHIKRYTCAFRRTGGASVLEITRLGIDCTEDEGWIRRDISIRHYKRVGHKNDL